MAVLADWGASGQRPSAVQTSGTAAVYFPRLGAVGFGPFGSGVITFPGAFGSTLTESGVQPTTTNATGQLLLPSTQYFGTTNGTRLRVIAAGTVWTAAFQTATVTVQINTGTAQSPRYTSLMTGTSSAFSGRASWFLESHLTIAGNTTQTSGNQAGMITQGSLSGFYFGAINGASGSSLIDFTAISATTNPVTLIGPSVRVPSFGDITNVSGLVANVAFSVGTAGNNATLNEFAVLGD